MIHLADNQVYNKKNGIFDGIVGYSDIKKEYSKAIEFLKQIRNRFEQESVFIDGSYGSKVGIFEKLYEKRPRL
jgi:hypothetical protein